MTGNTIVFFFCLHGAALLAAPGFTPLRDHALNRLLGERPGIFQIVASPPTEEANASPNLGTAFLVEVNPQGMGRQRYLVTALSRFVTDGERSDDQRDLIASLVREGGTFNAQARQDFAEIYWSRKDRYHAFRLFQPPSRGVTYASQDNDQRPQLQAFLTPPLLELVGIPTFQRMGSRDPAVRLLAQSDFTALRYAVDIAVFRVPEAGPFAAYQPLRIAAAVPAAEDDFHLVGFPNRAKASHLVPPAAAVVRRLAQEAAHVSTGRRLNAVTVGTIAGLPQQVRDSRVRALTERGVFFTDTDADFRCMGAPLVNGNGEVFGIAVSARYTLPENRSEELRPTLYVYPEYVIGADLLRYWGLLTQAARIAPAAAP